MILDDGGDATMLVHKAVEFEKAGEVPEPTEDDSEEYQIFLKLVDRSLAAGRSWVEVASHIMGVTEETTTGVHRLYEMLRGNKLLFSAINVNDSVTKSKFDNKYGVRHSLIDGLNRATDVLIGGKVAVVCGYGDVGKGSAESLRGQGARVIVTEVDPICALQAAMDGYQVTTLEETLPYADIYVTATGLQGRHHRRAHAADEPPGDRVQHRPLRQRDRHGRSGAAARGDEDQHQAAGRRVAVRGRRGARGAEHHRAQRGPADEPGQRDRAPELRDEQLLHQPGAGPDRALHQGGRLPLGVYTLPKHLDEAVARLHLDALGVKLTELTERQADYLGVPVSGPYKSDHYRY